MRCPKCACLESKVVDSRSSEDGASIRRRRECLSCGARFTTYERREESPLMIQKKDGSLVGQMASEGTTPRRLTDLIGSLCDLTSGSGDKGTPIVLIQGYFDNYTTE